MSKEKDTLFIGVHLGSGDADDLKQIAFNKDKSKSATAKEYVEAGIKADRQTGLHKPQPKRRKR